MTNSLKLTTRGRYAVMAMVELGKSGEGRPMPLSEIAETGNISLSYLEQLVAGLRRQGLVKSHRGPGGGYSLAKPVSEIMIAEIMLAAEDSTPARRNGKNESAKAQNCDHTLALWDHIGEVLHASLRNISLDDVLKGRMDLAVAA